MMGSLRFEGNGTSEVVIFGMGDEEACKETPEVGKTAIDQRLVVAGECLKEHLMPLLKGLDYFLDTRRRRLSSTNRFHDLLSCGV
jgi:hypothetical protein